MDWGTNGLTRFKSPIAVAILLHSLSMWECHVKFSSVYIPRDFTEETCSIGTLSIESLSVSDRVLNLCLEQRQNKFSFFSIQGKSVSHLAFQGCEID